MSRRGKTIVKRVVLDPKFNSELVAHMIRVIMKDGKKTVAEKIVYGATFAQPLHGPGTFPASSVHARVGAGCRSMGDVSGA